MQASGSSTNSGALSRILHKTKLAASTLNSGALNRLLHKTTITGGSLSFGNVLAGIGEAPCDFTLGSLRTRLWKMLDDADGGQYYSRDFIDHCLNRAQRLFALLSLCIERTVTFNLTNGQAFYLISDQISDFVAPLRISFNGTRLRSDRIHDMDSRDSTWRARPGNPARYATLGFDLLAITPQPVSGVNTLDFTYSAEPPLMVNPTDVPTLPGDQQAALLDGAYYFCRLPEGGAELQAATVYLKRFIDQAQKYAAFVRSKSRGPLYDVQSFDLRSFDRGRLDVVLVHRKTMQKKKQEDAK